ncbi:MAG: hypothetical protein JXA03_02710 [Bacteroidales bacterium]|nr:hypothetical protein [Bacteroidales bacterium]
MFNPGVVHWYAWLSLISALICVISLGVHVYRLVKAGNPVDYSQKRGNTGAAIRYSMTRAMSPARKESAYLHLPTYTAGIIYHLGTFIAIPVFVLSVFNVPIPLSFAVPVSWFLVISGVCGAAIFVKRGVKKDLRYLSNPDDFISNFLVSAVHFTTALYLYSQGYDALYFISVSVLLLYMPLGKLRHAVYFFAARYHLGFFYGWRGVWPPK